MASQQELIRVSMALKDLKLSVYELVEAFSELFDDHILWQESYGRDPSGLREGSMQKHVLAYLRDFLSEVEGPPDLSAALLTPWNHSKTLGITTVLHAGVADILHLMRDHEMIPPGIKRLITSVLLHMDAIVLMREGLDMSTSPATSDD
ncbi:hypothetical protein V2G26_005574 [Clonostachys chloroleuca]